MAIKSVIARSDARDLRSTAEVPAERRGNPSSMYIQRAESLLFTDTKSNVAIHLRCTFKGQSLFYLTDTEINAGNPSWGYVQRVLFIPQFKSTY